MASCVRITFILALTLVKLFGMAVSALLIYLGVFFYQFSLVLAAEEASAGSASQSVVVASQACLGLGIGTRGREGGGVRGGERGPHGREGRGGQWNRGPRRWLFKWPNSPSTGFAVARPAAHSIPGLALHLPVPDLDLHPPSHSPTLYPARFTCPYAALMAIGCIGVIGTIIALVRLCQLNRCTLVAVRAAPGAVHWEARHCAHAGR